MFSPKEINSYLIRHTGKTGYVINDSEYKEDPGLLTQIWIMIQGAFGAKVETFAQRRESHIIKEAGDQFSKLSHALMTGNKRAIAKAVEKYNLYHFTAGNRLDNETLTDRATDVLTTGMRVASEAVLELADKTDTLADQLFSVVIRQKSASILNKDAKSLPDGAILERFKDNPEKAVRDRKDPASLAVAYLLRKEGEAGKIYEGLAEIDLQKEFDRFVQEEYSTSALSGLMDSAKPKITELKRLRKEYRKSRGEEVLDQMVHLSAQLQGVASRIAAAVKEFESSLDAQTEEIASLDNKEVRDAWKSAASKHTKEARALREEAKQVATELQGELSGYEKIIAGSEESLLKKLQTTFSGLEKQTSAPQVADDTLVGSVVGCIHWGFVQLGLAQAEAKSPTIGEMITDLRKGVHHSMSHPERARDVLEFAETLKDKIDARIEDLKSVKESVTSWNKGEEEWLVEVRDAALERQKRAEENLSKLKKKHGESRSILHQQVIVRAEDELTRAKKSVEAAKKKVENQKSLPFKVAVALDELERASEWVDFVGLEREILFVARQRVTALKAGSESLESYSTALDGI